MRIIPISLMQRAGRACPVSHGTFSALAQIALGPLIATSNFNMTAALRTVPAIDKSANDKGGCCFANASRRVLTPLIWSTSFRSASRNLGTVLQPRFLRSALVSRGWQRFRPLENGGFCAFYRFEELVIVGFK